MMFLCYPEHPGPVVGHACPYVENNKSPGPVAFATRVYPLCVGGGHKTSITPANLEFLFCNKD